MPTSDQDPWIQLYEANSMQKVNFSKNDAHDQFPTTIMKVHQFYFVKFQSVEYLHLKAKVKEAEKRISNLNQSRSGVAEKLQERTVICIFSAVLDADFMH